MSLHGAGPPPRHFLMREGWAMCRSIITLRGTEPASDEEVRAAALQFVRKVSGYRAPSRANAEVFDRAVDEVAGSVRRLLDGLVVPKAAAARVTTPSLLRRGRA
jgi:hypothetical protein